jgi:FdhD protein
MVEVMAEGDVSVPASEASDSGIASGSGVPQEARSGDAAAYPRLINGTWERFPGALAAEHSFSLRINGHELVGIMCTPKKVKYLVLGFLRAEGLITGVDDVEAMRICLPEGVAEVQLVNPFVPPERRTITSGCGGGVALDYGFGVRPVSSSWQVSPQQILDAMKTLRGAPEGLRSGAERLAGMHVSALSDGHNILCRATDIGRHNTVDKIWGECMLDEVDTADRLLVTTGRVSSEMLLKAAKMGVPVVASLKSATQRAVPLGVVLGIAVVGYARGEQLTVYSHPERIPGCPLFEAAGVPC